MSANRDGPVVEHPLQVVHAVPGRIRLRWRQLRSLPPERPGEIADACVAEDGVLDVKVHRPTGSVLVVYDPALLTASEVAALVLAATGASRLLEPDEEPPEEPAPPLSKKQPSRLGVAAARFFEELDRDVRLATDGHADMATLLPFAFVGLGLFEVGATGEAPAPPWWSLFWWSFRAFLSLNEPAIEEAAAIAADPAADE